MRKTVGILGTPIDILDTAAVLERLEQFIHERRFHQVATANTDFLVNALTDPELRHILRNADLVVPDGMPVVWAARLTHSYLPERVTGADIVPALARVAAEKGYRIFMLGGRPDIAQRARVRLETDYPDIQIVGCISPDIKSLVEANCDDLLEAIQCAQPDVLLVAFGNPKQEKWIHLYRDQLQHVPVCIGVGGTFDFLAGETPRAPAWMQRRGLEWAFRLMHEPRRLWKRYVRDMVHFARFIFRQWWALRRTRFATESDFHEVPINDCMVVSLIGDFGARLMDRFQATADKAFNAQKHLVLDFHNVTSFDGEGLGTLLNLPKRAAFQECEVRLVNLPPTIDKALRRSQMQDGRYKIMPTLAQAIGNAACHGLHWHLHIGAQAAAISVDGAAERASTRQLEQVCANLLQAGHRLDLDLRAVTYADTYLAKALYRLVCIASSEQDRRFRLIIGETLRRVLTQSCVLEKFTLRDAPEIPEDAVRIASSGMENISDSPVALYVPHP
jgi:exopolysaccharide biosynthesis WecB/TagA/CpsF family protein/anti-anti-sigma factor